MKIGDLYKLLEEYILQYGDEIEIVGEHQDIGDIELGEFEEDEVPFLILTE